jgi:hypothetical protein
MVGAGSLWPRKRGQNMMKLSLQKNKIGASLSSSPLLPPNANVFFCRFLKKITWFWSKLRVIMFCFPDFRKTLMSESNFERII